MHVQSSSTDPIAASRGARGPVVWVCMAVFNRLEYTRKCLRLLTRQTFPDIQVVIVDDGSTDGTLEMLRREHPEVTVIRTDGSLYWTGAMHKGVSCILERAAPDDYTLLLNNDLIFGPDLVQKLMEVSRKHPRCLIQAVESCVNDPDTIWAGGVKVNWWTAKHRLINFHRRISDFPQGHLERSDWVTGRGVLLEIQVFREAGNFDNGYQQSGDPEFARRASRSGFRSLVAYDVRVLSYEKGNNLNEAESFAFSDAWRYYFGVLSNARLRTRWKFAMDATESRVQGLTYFSFDVARITWHFLTRLRAGPSRR
jgi:GT2 family glycosyltransferase